MRISSFLSGRAMPCGVVLSAACLALLPPADLGAQAVQAPAAQAPATAVDLPAARAIIDKHIEAVGGRKAVLAHSSVHVRGTISVPATGMNGTIETFAAKPDKALVRITLPGVGEMLDGYDGRIGWSVNPMTGPSLNDGKQLEEKKYEADFYSDLKDPARYESMTTVEKTTFDGRECYKVSLVRKGGGEDFEFYDVATGLKAGMIASREMPMGTVSSTQTFTDYRKFGQLLHPTTMKLQAMGMDQIFTFTAIEYDKVDPAVFELPGQIKALIK